MKRFLLLPFLAIITFTGCGPKSEQIMNKDFLDLAHERFSVRKFADTPVSGETIDKIIEAGRIAPTAVNSQPQKIFVVKTPEIMTKLNKVSPCIYGAPQCFVFCYDNDNVCKRGENGNYGEIDVTIVLTHMMLEAANLGVGTCIVGYFDPQALMEELGLPDNLTPVLLMPFGYAAPDCEPSPRHTDFRPLEETVAFL